MRLIFLDSSCEVIHVLVNYFSSYKLMVKVKNIWLREKLAGCYGPWLVYLSVCSHLQTNYGPFVSLKSKELAKLSCDIWLF